MEVSLQAITTHYNPLQSITTHYDSLQTSSCFCQHPCQTITVHYNPLQSITIHYDWQKMALNPPLNPYLLAPPNQETGL